MAEKKDNPGVVAPPPLIFLSGIILGGIINWFHPLQILPGGFAVVLGNLFFLCGIGLIAVAFAQMRKAKTNIEPWKPTTAIIDKWVYGISRNPIYLGMAFIYLGISLFFNSIWLLLILPIILFVIHYGVILREEKYLAEKFGEEYLSYKKRVRRWI